MVPATPRTSPARRARVVAAALSLAALLVGCTGGTVVPDEPVPEPQVGLSDLDTDTMVLARRDPCGGITDDRLGSLLGEGAEQPVTWAPGETVPDVGGVGDEYGCRVTGDVTASAWVFAPPVTAREARGLVKDATAMKCRRRSGATAFGSPGVAFGCALNSGETIHGVRGLVGDAWVACEVRGGDAALTDRWCAAVLESLSSSGE